MNPIIAWDGVTGGSRVVTRASYSSCFVTTDTELAADNDQFYLTIDLGEKYLVDGFMLE